jgi:hypothetical protein
MSTLEVNVTKLRLVDQKMSSLRHMCGAASGMNRGIQNSGTKGWLSEIHGLLYNVGHTATSTIP